MYDPRVKTPPRTRQLLKKGANDIDGEMKKKEQMIFLGMIAGVLLAYTTEYSATCFRLPPLRKLVNKAGFTAKE